MATSKKALHKVSSSQLSHRDKSICLRDIRLKRMWLRILERDRAMKGMSSSEAKCCKNAFLQPMRTTDAFSIKVATIKFLKATLKKTAASLSEVAIKKQMRIMVAKSSNYFCKLRLALAAP